MPLTVGTAGHIDHGKTWLVRALTGKDTDRLPEEQARGISIDLGYAPLDLPDGRRLSLIDVPGHERFVRNMVAGASGIDLFLLVVDAGEGARPQTLEHLAIVRLLGIEHGVVAITKADAVEPELVELVVEEARELVPGAEVVVTSAKTGEGLDELRGGSRGGGGPRGRGARRGRDEALRRPRLHPARNRDGRDRDALVGIGRRGRRPARRAGRARRARSQRSGARPAGGTSRSRAARRGGASGSRAQRPSPRRRARRTGCLPHFLPPGRRARRARGDPGRDAPARPPRDGRALRAGRPRRRALGAAPPRLARGGGARRPRRPPRPDDRGRRPRPRPGSSPPRKHRPASSSSNRATSQRSSTSRSGRPR